MTLTLRLDDIRGVPRALLALPKKQQPSAKKSSSSSASAPPPPPPPLPANKDLTRGRVALVARLLGADGRVLTPDAAAGDAGVYWARLPLAPGRPAEQAWGGGGYVVLDYDYEAAAGRAALEIHSPRLLADDEAESSEKKRVSAADAASRVALLAPADERVDRLLGKKKPSSKKQRAKKQAASLPDGVLRFPGADRSRIGGLRLELHRCEARRRGGIRGVLGKAGERVDDAGAGQEAGSAAAAAAAGGGGGGGGGGDGDASGGGSSSSGGGGVRSRCVAACVLRLAPEVVQADHFELKAAPAWVIPGAAAAPDGGAATITAAQRSCSADSIEVWGDAQAPLGDVQIVLSRGDRESARAAGTYFEEDVVLAARKAAIAKKARRRAKAAAAAATAAEDDASSSDSDGDGDGDGAGKKKAAAAAPAVAEKKGGKGKEESDGSDSDDGDDVNDKDADRAAADADAGMLQRSVKVTTAKTWERSADGLKKSAAVELPLGETEWELEDDTGGSKGKASSSKKTKGGKDNKKQHKTKGAGGSDHLSAAAAAGGSSSLVKSSEVSLSTLLALDSDDDSLDDDSSAAAAAAAAGTGASVGGAGAPAGGPSADDGLTKSKILARGAQEIEMVCDMMGVRRELALALLRHYKWDQSALLADYFDDRAKVADVVGMKADDLTKSQLQADESSESAAGGGAASASSDASSSAAGEDGAAAAAGGGADDDDDEDLYCGICMDDDPDELKSLPFASCKADAHVFCADCWRHGIGVKVKEADVLAMKCMGEGCVKFVPEEFIRAIVDPEVFARYQTFTANSFVDTDDSIKWCPHPGCERAIAETGTKTLGCGVSVAHCGGCSSSFCYSCLDEAHAPATCAQTKKWRTKNEDDSETALWIAANTKPCPKCQVSIQKNDGCFQMTCGSCYFNFCWLCLDDWKTHNDHFSCAKFRDGKLEDKPVWMDSDKDTLQERSRKYSDKYLHYFNRFVQHDKSKEFSEEAEQKIAAKRAELIEAGMTPHDCEFLQDTARVLSSCRLTLKWSYVWQFYCDTALHDEVPPVVPTGDAAADRAAQEKVAAEHPQLKLSKKEIARAEVALELFAQTVNLLEELAEKLAQCIERDLDKVSDPGARFKIKGLARVTRRTVANILESQPDIASEILGAAVIPAGAVH